MRCIPHIGKLAMARAVLLPLALAACDAASVGEPPVPVLVVEPANFAVAVADTIRLTAVLTAPTSTSAVWESSDPSIATVDEGGLVTGRSPGAVQITATIETYRATAQGSVRDAD